MFWEVIVPIFIVLLICHYILSNCQYKRTYSLNNNITSNNIISNSCCDNNSQQNNSQQNNSQQNNSVSPEYRLDTCSVMKTDECPMGSYKQCTNNIMKHPKCDCSDQKSFEVCSNNNMDNLLCTENVLENEAKDYGKYAIRVNGWTVPDTEFNDPGNLHINRTNPYVEEL